MMQWAPIELLWLPDDEGKAKLPLIGDPEGQSAYGLLTGTVLPDLRHAEELAVKMEVECWNNELWRPRPASLSVSLDSLKRLVLDEGPDLTYVRLLGAAGHRWLPFESLPVWWDQDRLGEVEKLLERRSNHIYTPITLPRFRGIQPQREGAFRLSRLGFIWPYLLDTRVADIGCNIGYFSEFAARGGSDVVAFESDPSHWELASVLKSAQGLDYELRRVPFEDSGFAALATTGLLLSVLYHQLNDNDALSEFLRSLRRARFQRLIYETGPEAHGELYLLNRELPYERLTILARTFATGHWRSLVVLEKPLWA